MLVSRSKPMSGFYLKKLGFPGQPTYKAFTKAHDEIIRASDFIDDEEFTRLAANLREDKQKIYRALSEDVGKELDAGFKVSHVEPKDTVVSMLIDNSGSLRGQPIRTLALFADLLAAKLEMLGVRTEVLGHTTRSWKGGLSRQDWMNSGKPENPGRLADLRFIVYKDASNSWHQSKRNLALMIREGLLKENIDGEALEWAESRLLKIPAKRRILVYIGDFGSSDDSTLSVNPACLLSDHFKFVAKRIVRLRRIELCGIALSDKATGMMSIFPRDKLLQSQGSEITELQTPAFLRRVASLFVQPS